MTAPAEPRWRKSTFSDAQQQCVELAEAGEAIWLRDSKHPADGHLTLTRGELAAFVAGVKAGELDSLAVRHDVL